LEKNWSPESVRRAPVLRQAKRPAQLVQRDPRTHEMIATVANKNMATMKAKSFIGLIQPSIRRQL
jgi:hypothetical protein